MQSIIIGSNQAGQRLDKFLRKCLPEAGSGFLYKMLRKKNITLNGKKAEGKRFFPREMRLSSFFRRRPFRNFLKPLPRPLLKKNICCLSSSEGC